MLGLERVRVRTDAGVAEVSGLSRREAAAFASAVSDARLAGSWHKLGPHRRTIGSVDARSASLSRPTSYVRRRAFAALLDDVQTAVPGLPRRWPEWAPRGPESEALDRIRALLAQPEELRERANAAFLVDELVHARAFRARVEQRPLTDEQGRAVCVGDDRNLIVAAACSGKTSVMVAK